MGADLDLNILKMTEFVPKFKIYLHLKNISKINGSKSNILEINGNTFRFRP